LQKGENTIAQAHKKGKLICKESSHITVKLITSQK